MRVRIGNADSALCESRRYLDGQWPASEAVVGKTHSEARAPDERVYDQGRELDELIGVILRVERRCRRGTDKLNKGHVDVARNAALEPDSDGLSYFDAHGNPVVNACQGSIVGAIGQNNGERAAECQAVA